MSTARWRLGLLALVAFGVFSLGVMIWSMLGLQGHFGMSTDSTATPFVLRVSSIVPGSAAARAGVRVGDLVDLRVLTPAQRFDWQYLPRRGEQVALNVTRRGAPKLLTLTATRNPISWSVWLVMASELWMLLFAALMAWRRPDSPHARVLALFLALFPISIDWFPHNSITPWPALSILLGLTLYSVGFPASMVLLAGYATRFTRPLTPARRALTYFAYAGAAAAGTANIAQLLSSWTAQFDPNTPLFTSALSQFALYVAMVLFPLLCAFAAIRATEGDERGRIIWVTLTIGTIYIAAGIEPTITFIAPALEVPPASGVVLSIQNTLTILAPLGMAYAIFNRRLVDFGFVLNRAAIFSGVSIVTVGLFVLVEWALSEWLRTASHETNIAVSAGLALLLGLSIRYVHAKVERVVDHVMFRKRREDEEAIRQMARQAPYITDRDTLLERVGQVLGRHPGASLVNVLLDDGRGHFGGVDENDPALVTLRAEHARIDLHSTQTAIQGEWAYPMVARGRLAGALVLGPKQSQESYAPDESAAIAQLAHSIAGALDLLSLKGESEPHSLAHLTDALRAAVSEAVSDGFERLEQRITS